MPANNIKFYYIVYIHSQTIKYLQICTWWIGYIFNVNIDLFTISKYGGCINIPVLILTIEPAVSVAV